MSTARFSPFELLLLKSRSQVDTATLLLLGWVLVHRQHVSEGQRRRRLAQVTSQFRHGHELGPVMSIAHSQDLHAIQLAAEVVRKECSKERSLSVMHQAITVATDDGDISLANHYILRFLADLLNVAPATLGTLFQELTGQPLRAEAAQRAKASQAEQEQQQRAKADKQQEKKQKQQEKKQQKEDARRAKARAEQSSAEQAKAEKARAEQARQEQARQERARQEQAQEESRQRQQRSSPPPPDRTTRALAVLGLTPGASKTDVRRAYRRMAQLHHPDRFYSDSEHQVALASARFQRIKNAYDYLMQTY